MKREKRTIRLMPDLAQRVDETAAIGGVSPSAIIETALDEHFARESMYSAVEALTRRVGELDERLAAQQAMLAKLDTAVGAIGRGVLSIKETLKPSQPVQEDPQPAMEREPEPAAASRPAGGLLAGWRR